MIIGLKGLIILINSTQYSYKAITTEVIKTILFYGHPPTHLLHGILLQSYKRALPNYISKKYLQDCDINHVE
jgi:hypothetical protein